MGFVQFNVWLDVGFVLIYLAVALFLGWHFAMFVRTGRFHRAFVEGHWPHHDSAPPATMNTLTLVETGGRTTLTTVVEYPSEQVRDEVLATGMLDGWAESYDRLEEYLRTVR